MSIAAGASGDFAERTANVPDPNNFTFCGWFHGNSGSGTSQHFMNLDNGSDNGIEFQFDSDNDIRVWDGRAGTVTAFPSAPSRTGEWFFAAMRSNGTGALTSRWATMDTPTFVNHTSEGSGTFAAEAWEFSILAEFDSGQVYLGRAAHVKVWDAELTDNELYLEMYSQLPVRLANLNFAWRVISASSVTDIGPNARNATLAGSLVVEEDPPIDDSIWCPQFSHGALAPPAASPLRWLRGNPGLILRGDAGRYLRAA